jgi:hypothetical protein
MCGGGWVVPLVLGRRREPHGIRLGKLTGHAEDDILGRRCKSSEQGKQLGVLGCDARRRLGAGHDHKIAEIDAEDRRNMAELRKAEGTVAGLKSWPCHQFDADGFRQGFLRPITVAAALPTLLPTSLSIPSCRLRGIGPPVRKPWQAGRIGTY